MSAAKVAATVVPASIQARVAELIKTAPTHHTPAQIGAVKAMIRSARHNSTGDAA